MEPWMLQDLRRQHVDGMRNGRKDAHNRRPMVTSPDDLRRRRIRRLARARVRDLVRG